MRSTSLLLMPLFAIACDHASVRDNPLDPALTPGVQIVSVTVDSLAPSMQVTWRSYVGDSLFGSYVLERATVGTADPGIVVYVTESVGDTVAVDTTIEVDRTYQYQISVMSREGFRVPSERWTVGLQPDVPSVSVFFDPYEGHAVLTWQAPQPGFERHDVYRRRLDSGRTDLLHRTHGIHDTRFIDRDLVGNVRYDYQVVLRTTTGSEIESNWVSGSFYTLREELRVVAEPSAPFDLMEVEVAPSGLIYVSAILPYSLPIRQLTGIGERWGVFPGDEGYTHDFSIVQLDADDYGYYVLHTDLGWPVSSAYIQAFDHAGEHRFRWPSRGGRDDLVALAADAGRLWAATAAVDMASFTATIDTIYELDAADGSVQGTIVPDSVQIWVTTLSGRNPVFEVSRGVAYVGGGWRGDFERDVVAVDLADGTVLPSPVDPTVFPHPNYATSPDDRIYRIREGSSSDISSVIQVLRDAQVRTSWQTQANIALDLTVDTDGTAYVLTWKVGGEGRDLLIDIYDP